jgi:transposase
MKINNEYIENIHLFVNKLCPSKRKQKYDFYYYIHNIIRILTDCTRWKSLQYNSLNKNNHYKTIYKKFIQWTNLKIFQLAYEKLIHDNILKKNNTSTTLNLFIDTTTILNKNGSELVTYGQNKKNRSCKISGCCNENKVIYGIKFHKGSESDVNTINDMVSHITTITKYRKINLIGDKGYISKEKKENLAKKKINLIVPYRKNMKNKKTKKKMTNTEKNKKKLKKIKKTKKKICN